MAESGSLGFHGKLPLRGDFVQRRVAGDFLAAWDPWLERCVHRSREVLGNDWLKAYLTSPMWRFVTSAGVCGGLPCTGVLMPSVDAVGRYYPLTLVQALPDGCSLLSLAAEQGAWFEAVEELALRALADDPAFDLDGFDQSLRALGRRLQPRTADPDSRLLAPVAGPLRFRLDSLADLMPALLAAQQGMLERQGGFSAWWTEGSERIAPCLFLHERLPEPDQFAAMIDGEWRRHGWDSRAARWQSAEPVVETVAAAPPVFRSAGVSHAGKVRQVNEDAWLDRPDLGLWVVADGVGGQQAGELASRSVVDSLLNLPAYGGDLQQRLNGAREMLAVAHRHLRHAATRPDKPVSSASTVVALLAGIENCCWLWAGDSRLYRLREGGLELCTRDHSMIQDMVDRGELSEEDARSHPQSNVITRAVGAVGELGVEHRYSDLRPGDRFLLCSDGIHGSLQFTTLREILQGESPQGVADALLAQVLAGEARDNATAVVVFVEQA